MQDSAKHPLSNLVSIDDAVAMLDLPYRMALVRRIEGASPTGWIPARRIGRTWVLWLPDVEQLERICRELGGRLPLRRPDVFSPTLDGNVTTIELAS